jgi:hypothetical protein
MRSRRAPMQRQRDGGDCMDAGGTTPRMGEVERRLEQSSTPPRMEAVEPRREQAVERSLQRILRPRHLHIHVLRNAGAVAEKARRVGAMDWAQFDASPKVRVLPAVAAAIWESRFVEVLASYAVRWPREEEILAGREVTRTQGGRDSKRHIARPRETALRRAQGERPGVTKPS